MLQSSLYNFLKYDIQDNEFILDFFLPFFSITLIGLIPLLKINLLPSTLQGKQTTPPKKTPLAPVFIILLSTSIGESAETCVLLV